MVAQDIIIKPLLSEKAYDGISIKKYTFIVANNANKIVIKQAVEELFEVKVQKVNVVNMRGKKKRVGRSEGYTAKYKKAIVQLKADSKPIAFFESLA